MQFINIVVHSVENMNFRVHLQYEFTHLGLDKYLEVNVLDKLRGCSAVVIFKENANPSRLLHLIKNLSKEKFHILNKDNDTYTEFLSDMTNRKNK